MIFVKLQEGGGSESSSSNASLKNAQSLDKRRSKASSESHSDSSDSSNNNKASCDAKCGRSKGAVAQAKTEQESDHEKDPSRRPSKDESFSSSSDSPSGDEYNVYYYDPKAAVSSLNKSSDAKNGDANAGAATSISSVLRNLKKTEDPWDILFARAEGLYAHGHTKEACILGVKLAEELLANPPNLMIEVPPMPVKGKRKKVNITTLLP